MTAETIAKTRMLMANGLNPESAGPLLASGKEDSADRPVRVVVAGGGTGGHLFPGIAIAEEFKKRFPNAEILFVNTGNPLERSALAGAGFALSPIAAEGLKNRGRWRQAAALVKVPLAVFASWRILGRMNPLLVMGVGGYSSGPVALAAWLRGIPVALHEQNRLPGLTNRLLGRLAKRIYLSFDASESPFSESKCLLTGNPVRSSFLTWAEKKKPAPCLHRSASLRPLTVLVAGGSQGAHAINAALIDALGFLKQTDQYRFIHQTGKADLGNVAAAYAKKGFSGKVTAFIDDMAGAYTEADLVICRAGATTVAEIAVMSKAALFIPFPYAADDHQTLNAQALAESGAAETLAEKDLDGKKIADRLRYYQANRAVLEEMGKKAGHFGKPDAAASIVADCCRMFFGRQAGGRPAAADGPRKGDG